MCLFVTLSQPQLITINHDQSWLIITNLAKSVFLSTSLYIAQVFIDCV